MKKYLAISGIVGLLIGMIIYIGASLLITRVPILVTNTIGAAIIFVILLIFTALEMPMMIYGLRQIACSETMPRTLLMLSFTAYVLFASVYASIFILLTGQVLWGIALAVLGFARFLSGILIK